MTVESVTYINTLDETRPAGGDKISEGDNHIRNIKRSLKETYPNVDGEVRATDEEMNFLVGLTEPIKDSLDGGSQDITDIKDELAKKADIKYVDDQDALKADKKYVDDELAKKADTTYVDDELAEKADKSDLDALDNYDHWGLGVRGDPDVGVIESKDIVLFDAGSGIEISRTDLGGSVNSNHLMRFALSQDIKDQIDQNEQDISTNAGNIDANTSSIVDLQDQLRKMGGGMIKPIQQPVTAGDFRIEGRNQVYRANVAVGTQTKKLVVPNGKVFVFEYLYGDAKNGGTLRINFGDLFIDGVDIYSNSVGSWDFTETSAITWPGNDRGPLIRVEESFEIKNMNCYVADCEIHLAGFFTEA